MMMNTDNWTGSKGSLYTLIDTLAEKCFSVVEYANDNVAKRAMGQLKIPPGVEAEDFKLFKVGQRDGLQIFPCDPEIVWTSPDLEKTEVLHG